MRVSRNLTAAYAKLFEILDKDSVSQSFVYFLRADDSGFVKVGRTKSLRKRVAQLQTGCPHQISLIGVVRGGRITEKFLHSRLCGVRVRGEWFEANEFALNYIQELDRNGKVITSQCEIIEPWSNI